jgi:hypothetical protein
MAVVTQNEDIKIKREKEQDWLFIGNQYQRAIASYYNNPPNGIKTLPIKLEDLLLDSRFIAPVRHLRKLYGDPLNHQQDWTLIKTQDEQIIGVYSKSNEAILSKKIIFETLVNLDDQVATYSEIQFVFKPKQMPESNISESRIDDKDVGLQ